MSAVKKQDCSCCIMSIINKNPTVSDLVYWREPFKSGLVMTAGLSALVSLACLSLISVVAYACIALLCCTGGWRLYNEFLGRSAARKAAAASGDGQASSSATATSTVSSHPFQRWLTCDLTLPRDSITEAVAHAVEKGQPHVDYLRRAIMVQNYVETGKFAVILYLLTILGAWFNLLTLITLAFVGLFTIPKIYELYQPQIDHLYAIAKAHVDKILSQVRAKLETLPVVGKKMKSN